MFLKGLYSAWALVLLIGRTVNALPTAGADIGSVVDASQPAPPASAKAELPNTRQLTPPPSEDRRRRPWEQPIRLAREEEIERGDPPQSDYDLVSASTINVAQILIPDDETSAMNRSVTSQQEQPYSYDGVFKRFARDL